MRSVFVVAFVSVLTACGAATPVPGAPPSVTPAQRENAAPPLAIAPRPAVVHGEGCGPLACLAFDSPEDAIRKVLETRPLVLAVGEAHAQRGTESIQSSTHRFTQQLLPLLEPVASDLVLELWVTEGACGQVEQQVATQQKEVTETQAETNQNEFVTLASRSKERGIRPHVLRPTCTEYEQIVAANNDVARMLTMIAEHSSLLVQKILARNAAGGVDKVVIAYGGAMHNDLHPREGREGFSFGPQLSEHTQGRYVELDMFVPEYIKDTESWRAMPWYEHYDADKLGDRAVLFQPAPGSFVLIFPRGVER